MPDDSGSSKLNKKPKFIERFFGSKSDTEKVQETEEAILHLNKHFVEYFLKFDIIKSQKRF